MFAAVPERVNVEVAVSALKVAVPENAGAFEKTRRPEPVSSPTIAASSAEVSKLAFVVNPRLEVATQRVEVPVERST
jgi:hypothetical protein